MQIFDTPITDYLADNFVDIFDKASLGAIYHALDETLKTMKQSLILNRKWILQDGKYEVASNQNSPDVIETDFFTLQFGTVKNDKLDEQFFLH